MCRVVADRQIHGSVVYVTIGYATIALLSAQHATSLYVLHTVTLPYIYAAPQALTFCTRMQLVAIGVAATATGRTIGMPGSDLYLDEGEPKAS